MSAADEGILWAGSDPRPSCGMGLRRVSGVPPTGTARNPRVLALLRGVIYTFFGCLAENRPVNSVKVLDTPPRQNSDYSAVSFAAHSFASQLR